MADKVIVSNRSALTAKYGAEGVKKINSALRKLVAADKERRLTTKVVFLDDATAMAELSAPPVTAAPDEAQNKAAIDAVSKKLKPDYLMLLGSVDVIPHIALENPLFDPDADDDEEDAVVPSDLPYACEAPFSRKIDDFIAPSRVVGRLPDITGADNPKYLLEVLAHAADPVTSTPKSMSAFAVTAKGWRRSTSLSLRALFGAGIHAEMSPDSGPKWTDDQLAHRVHFFNCHGDKRSPRFFGDADEFPTAHDASLITGRVGAGTLVAAECCYGAELYNPHGQTGQISISNTYLECGSVGYFGSTTIAYGPATRNNYADVICRLFIEETLKGRSTGDAALTARLRYAKEAKPIDTVDLKTLAQFLLLGDPSIHPVRKPRSKSAPKAKARALGAGPSKGPKAVQQAFDIGATARTARRDQARTQAAVLEATASVASQRVTTSSDVAAVLARRAADEGMTTHAVMTFATRVGSSAPRSFAIEAPTTASAVRRATRAAAPSRDVRIHVALARADGRSANRRLKLPMAIVAREEGGQVTDVETIYGKGERAVAGGQSRQASRRR